MSVLIGGLWLAPWQSASGTTIWDSAGTYNYIVQDPDPSVKRRLVCRSTLQVEHAQFGKCAPESLLIYSPLVICATLLELAVVTRMLAGKVSLQSSIRQTSRLCSIVQVGFEIEQVERRVVTQNTGGKSSVTVLVNIAMAEGCTRFALMLCSVAFLITYTSDCLSAFNIALAGTVNVIFYILIIALVMLIGIISSTLVHVNLSDLPSVKGFVESSIFVWFLGMAFLIVMPVAIGSVERALLMRMPLLMHLTVRRYAAVLDLRHMIVEYICKRKGGKGRKGGEEGEEGQNEHWSESASNVIHIYSQFLPSIGVDLKGVNWTNILTCGCWLGIAFVALQVGIARVTTLFLSWLNVFLSTKPLAVVIVLFIGVGKTSGAARNVASLDRSLLTPSLRLAIRCCDVHDPRYPWRPRLSIVRHYHHGKYAGPVWIRGCNDGEHSCELRAQACCGRHPAKGVRGHARHKPEGTVHVIRAGACMRELMVHSSTDSSASGCELIIHSGN